MPLTKGSSRENCISQAYKKEIEAGKGKEQARAIALNHCNKQWGGISKKKDKKKEDELFEKIDLEILKENINKEIESMKKLEDDIMKQKKILSDYNGN